MLSDKESSLGAVETAEASIEASEKALDSMEAEFCELVKKGPNAILDYLEQSLSRMATAFEANQQNIIQETNILRQRVGEIEDGLQIMLRDLTQFAEEMNIELPISGLVNEEQKMPENDERLISLNSTCDNDLICDNAKNQTPKLEDTNL